MFRTVVALVLFVASVCGTPTGKAKCSWGPSYWCQNYKQALECNALEHCRAKVWAVKNEEACDICQQVVPMVRDFLAKNTTQAEVVTLAEQVCEDIAGSLASMCKSVVDQYEPVIWNSVLDFMADPKQVCTEVGLCNSKKSKKADAKLVTSALPLKNHLKTILAPVLVAAKPKATVINSKPLKASAECILCEFIMKELDSILQENATKQEIEEALEEVCSLLPDTIKAECEQFVQQYTPAIIAILTETLDPSMVCTALGVCESDKHSKDFLSAFDSMQGILGGSFDACGSTMLKWGILEKMVTFAPGSNGTCLICETVMTYLKQLLADNTTKEEILSLLKELCNLLPTELSSQCNEIVSEYGPAILDLIATADPHELCVEIGLCTSALKKEFCFLGASYWCANKRNAISCNALKHCTDHVWN